MNPPSNPTMHAGRPLDAPENLRENRRMNFAASADATRCLHGLDTRYCAVCNHLVRAVEQAKPVVRRNKQSIKQRTKYHNGYLDIDLGKDTVYGEHCLHCHGDIDLLNAQYGKVILGVQVERSIGNDYVRLIDDSFANVEAVRQRVYLKSKTGYLCTACFNILDGKTIEKDGDHHLVFESRSLPRDYAFSTRPQSAFISGKQAEMEAKALEVKSAYDRLPNGVDDMDVQFYDI